MQFILCVLCVCVDMRCKLLHCWIHYWKYNMDVYRVLFAPCYIRPSFYNFTYFTWSNICNCFLFQIIKKKKSSRFKIDADDGAKGGAKICLYTVTHNGLFCQRAGTWIIYQGRGLALSYILIYSIWIHVCANAAYFLGSEINQLVAMLENC